MNSNQKIDRIEYIANKSLTYNKDINQHIESCKISREIIREKDHEIKTLRSMLIIRDEKIRNLEENNLNLKKENFIIKANKEIKEKELREVLTEQYKLIEDLSKELKMPWLD